MDKPGHVLGALAFITQGDRILLVKWRSKGQYWSLPGGTVELGESIEDAALREVFEETGLRVRVKRVVGVYSKPSEGAVAVTVEAEVIGGELAQETEETMSAAFFPTGALPVPVMAHLRQRVDDFCAGQPQAFLRTQ